MVESKEKGTPLSSFPIFFTLLTSHSALHTRHFLLPLPDISVSLSVIMKRRSFLSLSALSAVPVVARAAEDAPDWHETVTSDVMKFRCSDAEDRVVFEVEVTSLAETALPLPFKNPQSTIHNLQSSISSPAASPSPPREAPCSSNGIAPRNATPTPPSAGSSANPASSSDTVTARRMSAETNMKRRRPNLEIQGLTRT